MLIGSRTMMLDCCLFPVKGVFSTQENTDSGAWSASSSCRTKTHQHEHTLIYSILKLLVYIFDIYVCMCFVSCGWEVLFFIWCFCLQPTYFLSNYDCTVINTIYVNLLRSMFHNKDTDNTNNNNHKSYLPKCICWLLKTFWWLNFSLSITC